MNYYYSFPFIIISLGGAWINENDNVRMRTAASRQGIIDLFPLVSLLFYPCPPTLVLCQTKLLFLMPNQTFVPLLFFDYTKSFLKIKVYVYVFNIFISKIKN